MVTKEKERETEVCPCCGYQVVRIKNIITLNLKGKIYRKGRNWQYVQKMRSSNSWAQAFLCFTTF